MRPLLEPKGTQTANSTLLTIWQKTAMKATMGGTGARLGSQQGDGEGNRPPLRGQLHLAFQPAKAGGGIPPHSQGWEECSNPLWRLGPQMPCRGGRMVVATRAVSPAAPRLARSRKMAAATPPATHRRWRPPPAARAPASRCAARAARTWQWPSGSLRSAAGGQVEVAVGRAGGREVTCGEAEGHTGAARERERSAAAPLARPGGPPQRRSAPTHGAHASQCPEAGSGVRLVLSCKARPAHPPTHPPTSSWSGTAFWPSAALAAASASSSMAPASSTTACVYSASTCGRTALWEGEEGSRRICNGGPPPPARTLPAHAV